MPITKHNYIVKDVEELADVIREAFLIAIEGRPGPVLIDICKDVTSNTAEFSKKPLAKPKEYPIGVSVEEIEKATQIINNSKKPFIVSGGGTSKGDASEEVLELAQKAKIPVATTLMGMGTFPGTHELFTGMLGMHGTRTSNIAVSEADLFIAIGARFSDRVISNLSRFAPNAKIMHIDIDPAEVGKKGRPMYPAPPAEGRAGVRCRSPSRQCG